MKAKSDSLQIIQSDVFILLHLDSFEFQIFMWKCKFMHAQVFIFDRLSKNREEEEENEQH